MARVAVAQVNQDADVEKNFRKIEEFAATASGRGASLLCLPENCVYFGPSALSVAETIPGPLVERYQRLAASKSLWLSLGGFPERCSDPQKYHNTHILLSSAGEIAGVYRKLHLFDVALSAASSYLESEKVQAGNTIIPPIETPVGKIGLSICYDLRFPELYRRLTVLGAEILLVPAAFIEKTGYAHWEPLLRARAIENQCYVIAAAQDGRHSASRVNYGHSCVVDPWGEVTAMCSEGERLLLCDIDLDYLREVRSRIPCLQHRRSDLYD